MNIDPALLVDRSSISLIDLLISLSIAVLTGLWIVLVYRVTHRGMTYERSFLVTLVMSPPIVSIIMLLIGSNIALSLGLVGALSIIRFRNVIKESRDMVFLLWGIAVGLGTGTHNHQVVLVSAFFLGVVLLVLNFVDYGKTRHRDMVLVLSGTGSCPVESITETISRHLPKVVLRSLEDREDTWEMVCEIRFPGLDVRQQQALIEATRGIDNVEQVSLLAPTLALPI